MDYTRQDHEKARLEQLDTITRGCRALLGTRCIKTPRSREHTSFTRGGLGNFIQALSAHVSLSFLPTVAWLKQQSDALRAEGIEIVIHDEEGRDVELMPVKADPA
jgi:hypothetical protein